MSDTLTTEPTETATFPSGYDDGITCPCGNRPDLSGFYPSTLTGEAVEPTKDGPWDELTVICGDCGRLIRGGVDVAPFGAVVAGPSADRLAEHFASAERKGIL